MLGALSLARAHDHALIFCAWRALNPLHVVKPRLGSRIIYLLGLLRTVSMMETYMLLCQFPVQHFSAGLCDGALKIEPDVV